MFAAMISFFLAAGAQAEAASPDRAAQVRALASEAQVQYDLGHFRRALDLFEQVYQQKSDAHAILFNVAQCHRKLGELRAAADTYRSFLVKADAGSREAGLAQELLAEVEGALHEERKATAAPPHGTAPLEPPPARPAQAAAPMAPLPAPAPPLALAAPAPPPSHHTSYLLGGTGAALLAVGVVAGLKSHGAGSGLSGSAHPQAEAQSLADTYKGAAIAADLAFAFALALGLGAVLSW